MTMLRATAVVEVQESESHMEAERAGVKGYFRVGSYRRRVHSSLSRAARIKSDCRAQMRRSREQSSRSRMICESCRKGRYIRALGCVTCKGQRDVNSKVVATCGVG